MGIDTSSLINAMNNLALPTEKNIRDKWGPVDYEYQPRQVFIIILNIFSIGNNSCYNGY